MRKRPHDQDRCQPLPLRIRAEPRGNDVSLLQAIVPACQRVLADWRDAGGLVVHTREAHHADLGDCPPAKRNRGNPTLRIGDEGPMGRILGKV